MPPSKSSRARPRSSSSEQVDLHHCHHCRAELPDEAFRLRLTYQFRPSEPGREPASAATFDLCGVCAKAVVHWIEGE